MTGSRKKAPLGIGVYLRISAALALIAVVVLLNAFGTYNSTGDYDPTLGGYAEHGDATMGFVFGGLAAIGSLLVGVVAAVAKGRRVSPDSTPR